jgi:hypothetical protein
LLPQEVLLALLAQSQLPPEVHCLHAPAQLSAQHLPARHDPDLHSMPSLQSEPATLLSQTPPVQIIPAPHVVLFGLLPQFQPVADVHCLHTPEQAMLQHLPATHAFDWQSWLSTQSPPAGFFAGGAQRSLIQISPVEHGDVLGTHPPLVLHVERVRVVPEAQTEGAQLVPAAARPQAPEPLQPVVQASGLHCPVGSVPPAGTARHEPRDPSMLHAMHEAVQAVAQHRPCAQKFDTQSAGLLHSDPVGRFPHEFDRQKLPLAH